MIPLLVAVVAAVLLVSLLRLRRGLVAVTVRGDSMVPALRSGDRVLVRRTPLRALTPGSLVVFARPRAPRPGWMIKRIIAVPGDVIPRREVPALWGHPGDHVPAHRLVVLGDNPDESYDSRHFGYVRADAVLGVVERVLVSARQ
jgi:signal peptidase I